MKFAGDASELGALSRASVSVKKVIAVFRGLQSAPDTVDAKSTTELVQAVFAARTLGIHPARVSIAIEMLIELQALIDLPDVARRLARRSHSNS